MRNLTGHLLLILVLGVPETGFAQSPSPASGGEPPVESTPPVSGTAALAPVPDLLAPAKTPQGTLFVPPHLKIVWKLKSAKRANPVVKKRTHRAAWGRACATLSNSLAVQRGPWGFGAFNGTSCWIDGVSVAGKAAPLAWSLEYTELEDETVFRIVDDSGREQTSFKVEAAERSVEFFEDPEYADLIGMRLLDDLAVVGFLTKSMMPADGKFKARFPARSPQGSRKYPLVPPESSLRAYELFVQEDGTVFAKVIGKVIRISMDTEFSKKVEPSVMWRADKNVVAAVRGGRALWVHSQNGRGGLSAPLDEAIERANELLLDASERGGIRGFIRGFSKAFRMTTASGYAGVRYGRQLLKGDLLLQDLNFIGAVAEFRGGPLAGIRFYYDHVPENSVDRDGLRTSINWNRFIIGRSFGLDIDKFISRIDVTPKVGVWNFKIRVPDVTDEQGKVLSLAGLEVKNGLSLAFEVGTEWLSPRYALRLWYGFDGAGVVGQVSDKSVSSSRLGLDALWTGSSGFKAGKTTYKPAFLAFALYENIGLSGSGPGGGNSDGSAEIESLKIVNAYGGAGIAISW